MSERETVEGGAGNLAWHLREAFGRLTNKGNKDNRQMHQVWRDGLATPEGDASLYEALYLISTALGRLEMQVSSCEAITPASKQIFQEVINGLRVCTTPKNLNQPYQQMQPRFAPDKLNLLTVMGDTLKEPFPEPRLPESDLAEIRRALDDVIKLLSTIDAPEHVKGVLTSHLSFLQWVIDNYSLIGMDGAYEAMIKTRAVFYRFEPEISKTSGGSTAYTKIKRSLEKVTAVIDRADRMTRAGGRLYQVGQGVLESLGILGPPAG